MWFTMPPGATSITVEQQLFVGELTDQEGMVYFRAPNNFAGKILDLPGFTHKNPPADLNPPEDLVTGGPSQMAAEENVRALSGRISDLETQLSSARANLATVLMERDDLKLRALELQTQLDNFQGGEAGGEEAKPELNPETEAAKAAIADIAAQAAARSGRR